MAESNTPTRSGMGELLRTTGAGGTYKFKNYLFIIAINDYEHIADLKNCVRDAEEVIKLLTEDFEFEREEVRFICGDKVRPEFKEMVAKEMVDGKWQPARATRHTILNQLYRLAEQIKEDKDGDSDLKVNLILYYSGHGHLDKLINQGYWIPVDAKKKDYGKHISNSTISDFLSGIKTHHTLILSDSCFAGSIFASGTGKSIDATRLENVPSRWGITAGRNEIVSDGKGVHSPFADSFLSTLRSQDVIAADALGLLIRQRVASNEDQTPLSDSLRIPGHENGVFVFRKKANAFKHFEAGQLIMRLARHQPEYARFRAAANQFAMAVRLTKKSEDRANYLLWEMRALGYAGLFGEAFAVFEKGIKRIAEKDTKELKEIAQALGWSQKKAPLGLRIIKNTYLPKGGWSKQLASLYDAKHHKNQSNHFIQIAINEYESQRIPGLAGCINDLELMEEQLRACFEGQDLHVEKLFDAKATKAKITKQLTWLQSLPEDDRVFIHFSGQAMPSTSAAAASGDNSPYLICFDADLKESGIIDHRELHELLEAIPCKRKVIILDTDCNDAFYELAKEGNYTLLQGTQKGEHAKEMRIDNKPYGMFSYALAQGLANKNKASAKQQLYRIRSMIAEKVKDQHPFFLRAESFFEEINTLSFSTKTLHDHLYKIFYGPRNSPLASSMEELIVAIEQLDLSFTAEQWQELAETLSSTTDSSHRTAYYEKSIILYKSREEKETHAALLQVHLQLAGLYAENGDLKAAKNNLSSAYNYLSDGDKAKRDYINKKLKHFEGLAKNEKHALLVGIGKYEHLDPVGGITEDLKHWKNILLGLGYEEKNITLLQDASATRSQILSKFKTLAKKAQTKPAFFFFRGQGLAERKESKETRGLHAYGSKKTEEASSLLFSEFAVLSESARHLTVVLDADFTGGKSVQVNLEGEEKNWEESYFGNTQWLAGIHDEATEGAVHQYHEAMVNSRGVLSTLLTNRLQQGGDNDLTLLKAPDSAAQVMLAGEWLPEEEEEEEEEESNESTLFNAPDSAL